MPSKQYIYYIYIFVLRGLSSHSPYSTCQKRNKTIRTHVGKSVTFFFSACSTTTTTTRVAVFAEMPWAKTPNKGLARPMTSKHEKQQSHAVAQACKIVLFLPRQAVCGDDERQWLCLIFVSSLRVVEWEIMSLERGLLPKQQ